MPKIILLGYMGAGKTTVARELAAVTALPVFDLDAEIIRQAGLSIPEIFARYGEIGFRKREKEALETFLSDHSDYILATGGGTPCYYGNMDVMNSEAETVFLRASVPTLLKRLSDEAGQRPLLAHLTEAERAEFIAKHLFERNAFYQMAKHAIAVDGKSPGAVASEIIERTGLR